ncbi:MAG: hypothetical protein COA73_05010 [Candidatus Hydrogenedentota bacterium]|nr:MAG: hypothetical protein COA73_05010 [Candidatus Hydrogenedentota bacterium]
MKAMMMKAAMCVMAVVVMAGCATGGGSMMSDEDAIKGLVDAAMTALKAQDIDTMVANYADSFESDQGGGVAETKEFLEGAKEQGFLDGIEVDTSSMEITVDGNKASAKPIDLEGAFGALTLEFELEKMDGAWKVTYQSQY